MLLKKILNLTNFGIMNIRNYLKSKGSGSLKSSSKHTISSSASSKASVKSKENLLKLRRDTTKAKLYVEQAE